MKSKANIVLFAVLVGAFSVLSSCGFYSFSEEDYFQDAVDDEVNNLVKGYKVYLKRQGLKMSSKEAKAKIKEMEEYVITNAPPNEGPTHRLSDHKPIWMQLKLF